jgi:hypothetical protein
MVLGRLPAGGLSQAALQWGRAMSGPRVLLMTLAERTSGKGNLYLSGWLGKARLVGFKAEEPDQCGNEVWEIYAQEPEPKADSDQARPSTRNAERGQRQWDRSRRSIDRAHDAQRPFQDDSNLAVADLEERGR